MLPTHQSIARTDHADLLSSLSASRSQESVAPCQCCGQQSKVIWGALADGGIVHGTYLVHLTVGRPDHAPHIDLILGPWGHGTSAAARVLVTIRYLPQPGGGTLSIIDSRGRPADDRMLCGRAHSPDVTDEPGLSRLLASAVAALWLTEPAVNALRELDQLAGDLAVSR